MNQDQNQPLEEDANRDHLAGSGPIERSESGAEPAGAGAMGGDAGGSESDWEAPQSVEEGDSQGWEPAPTPPNLKARRRGKRTLSKPETPQLPPTPQQKILLLDLWRLITRLVRRIVRSIIGLQGIDSLVCTVLGRLVHNMVCVG